MTVEDVRALLDRTGPLFTRDPEDVGHISDRWRKTILALCDLLDATPLDAAAQLREAQERIARLSADCDRSAETIADLCEQLSVARAEANEAERFALESRHLIEEAIPRMRSLNNQMSPGWLARADEFLGGR